MFTIDERGWAGGSRVDRLNEAVAAAREEIAETGDMFYVPPVPDDGCVTLRDAIRQIDRLGTDLDGVAIPWLAATHHDADVLEAAFSQYVVGGFDTDGPYERLGVLYAGVDEVLARTGITEIIKSIGHTNGPRGKARVRDLGLASYSLFGPKDHKLTDGPGWRLVTLSAPTLHIPERLLTSLADVPDGSVVYLRGWIPANLPSRFDLIRWAVDHQLTFTTDMDCADVILFGAGVTVPKQMLRGRLTMDNDIEAQPLWCVLPDLIPSGQQDEDRDDGAFRVATSLGGGTTSNRGYIPDDTTAASQASGSRLRYLWQRFTHKDVPFMVNMVALVVAGMLGAIAVPVAPTVAALLGMGATHLFVRRVLTRAGGSLALMVAYMVWVFLFVHAYGGPHRR